MNKKKYALIVIAIFFSVYMFGCAKKEASLQKTQEPMTMEELETLSAKTTTVPESKTEVVQTAPVTETRPEAQLPPPGPYKPIAREIQTALKNAGLYIGAIDGKIGPKTLKAIEEFQKANGLSVDGKVGPKTWAVLSQYLNPPPTPATTSKKR